MYAIQFLYYYLVLLIAQCAMRCFLSDPSAAALVPYVPAGGVDARLSRRLGASGGVATVLPTMLMLLAMMMVLTMLTLTLMLQVLPRCCFICCSC